MIMLPLGRSKPEDDADTCPYEYNTVEGIEEEYLANGLEGLNRLNHDRHVAGYERKERLAEFIILGHWVTDTCGNFSPLKFTDKDYKKVDAPPGLPPVIHTWEMERYGIHGYEATHKWSVPPVRIQCFECKQPWTLANAHDTYVEVPRKLINLAEYVGKTLAEVDAIYRLRTDAHYFLGGERSVRNDRLIDLTPDPKYEGCKINEKGWTKDRDLGDDYVIQEGDETSFNTVVFRHTACHDTAKRVAERAFFRDILTEAGFTWVAPRMTEIPNGYCPCEICGPWFLFSVPSGQIKIGWRKRVINIDWSATGKKLLHLFKDEDVTKEEMLIHAWGRAKAVKYLAAILPHV